MVGPSVDGDERRSFMFKLRLGFALFVGLSMALVSTHADAGLPVVGGAGLVGTGVGAALAWWIFPDRLSPYGDDRRRR